MLMIHEHQMRELADLLESGRVYNALLKVYEYGHLPGEPNVMAVYPPMTEEEEETYDPGPESA